MKNIEVKEITATSAITINLGNFNSGKLEFSMKKVINNPEEVNLEEEKAKLWEEVNNEVDKQAELLKQCFKK